jgi:hypothetical protein
MKLRVGCYSGHKANQRPSKFRLSDTVLFVESIEDQGTAPIPTTFGSGPMTTMDMSSDTTKQMMNGRSSPFGRSGALDNSIPISIRLQTFSE